MFIRKAMDFQWMMQFRGSRPGNSAETSAHITARKQWEKVKKGEGGGLTFCCTGYSIHIPNFVHIYI